MKKKIISITLDTELVEYHKKEAARQGRSFSNYINNLLNFPGYEKSNQNNRNNRPGTRSRNNGAK